MLLQADGDVDLDELLSMLLDIAAEGEPKPISKEYTTDYALARTIYPCFRSTPDEAALQADWERFKADTEKMLALIEDLQNAFPFSAAQMLSDPQQLEAYKKELEYRLYEAKAERKRLSQVIQSMLERRPSRG